MPSKAIEPSICGSCGGIMSRFLTTGDLNRAISDVRFVYLRCAKCGLISLFNVPHRIDAYYPSGYHQLPSTQDAIDAGVAHDQYKIDLVKRFVGSGRLLEVGPAWGAFCLLARRSGFSVEAIEMDEQCCDFLRTRFDIPTIRSDDEAHAIGQATEPDVIAAWHVMEHLRDPWRFLAAAARRLTPGGILVVAMPNPDAFQFRLLGKFWAHIDAPRHIHLIPGRVLKSKAEAAGLETMLLTSTDAGSLDWNRFGWEFSLPHLVSSPFWKRRLRTLGRVTSILASAIERREGLGSAYTAVFRKSGSGS